MLLQKFEMYKPKEQIKKWTEIKDSIGPEEKLGLIREIIGNKRDFWGHINLLAEVLYDVASDSEEYVQILEKATDIIKSDMAQGPFLQTLVSIGERKKDIGMRLRNRIVETSDNNTLILLSGLILGGVGKVDKNFALSEIKENITSERIPVLQSYLKTILVMNEKKKKVDREYIKILQKLLEFNNENLNIEILNFCLSNYYKNKSFFYGIIKDIVSRDNENYKRFIFGRLAYQDIIEEKKLFELINISKDANEKVLDEIVMCLGRYPSKNREILFLCFYWINKGLYFKIRNFDWVLEQLMKKDNSLLSLFIKYFRKVNLPYSLVIIPSIFEKLAKHNIRLAITEVKSIAPKGKLERQIKLELFRVIIGCIYKDKKNLAHVQRVAKYLLDISKDRPYIKANINKELLTTQDLNENKFNDLVDKVYNLINEMKVRWDKRFNYSKIFDNLKKYPYVKKYGEEVIQRCKDDKKYSPLFWLLENEVPDISKYKLTGKENELDRAIKANYIRGEFWPRAYLNELDKGLYLFEKINNPKRKTNREKKKYIQDILKSNESFWNFLSELIVMNRLVNQIKSKDFVIGENDVDLEAELFNKTIFFEITSPDIDRKLKLANGAIALKNKAFSVIEKKYKQLMKSGICSEPKYKDKFYFYIIIDISNSTIDEYVLLNALFGSEQLKLIFDKKERKVVDQYASRDTDSIGHKNIRTEVISGVIYFKRELFFRKDEKPFIKLIGKIINNPFGKRTLSEKELTELSKILFDNQGV
jgi:hypothetical protein